MNLPRLSSKRGVKACSNPPRRLFHLYVRDMAGIATGVIVLFLIALFYLDLLVRPAVDAAFFEMVRDGYTAQESFLQMALLQRNEPEAENLVADRRFMPTAQSRLFSPTFAVVLTAEEQCSDPPIIYHWGRTCRNSGGMLVTLPIRAGGGVLGYLQGQFDDPLTHANAYNMAKQVLFVSVGLLLVLIVVLTCRFYWWVGRPIAKMMNQIETAHTEHDVRSVLEHMTVEEIHRLTLALAQKIHQLDRAERLSIVGRLAAEVAHDLKQPLTTLRTFMRHLWSKGSDSRFQERFSEHVPRALAQIDRLSRDLLYVAQEYTPQVAHTDIGAFLSLAVIEYRSARPDLMGVLTVLLPDSLVWAEMDVQEMKRVLFNLLDNSVEAGALAVSVRLNDPFDARVADIEIKVKDNGPGLAPETRNRLFEGFFTTKNTGTGLGLTICERIVVAHGGHLSVASKVGLGSTFRITLPERQAA